MSRSLSPFTRLTLLITELKATKIEDMANSKKCDLAHHTARLDEEFDNSEQKSLAGEIRDRGTSLLSLITQGDLEWAENERRHILLTCRKLKDLL